MPLKHEADQRAADHRQLALGALRDVGVEQRHSPGRRAQDATDHGEERGLAGSRGPDEHDHLSLLDPHGDVGQRGEGERPLAKRLRHAGDVDRGGHRNTIPGSSRAAR